MYCGYITRIENLRKHSNADRLLCGECFGNTVIVDLKTEPNALGVYFPVDGKLGMEYAVKNDLLRRKDENGKPAGGYLDPEKRNIKALKLRGEKSDGLFMPLSSLSSFTDVSKLKEGDRITMLNGVTICEKYIPRANRSGHNTGRGGNRTRKKRAPIAPLFAEHADTEQLAYNLSAFYPGDLIEITLKMHGTSQRTGYLPVFKGFKRTLLDKLLRRDGTPVYDWGYVSGTRRTVLESYEGGWYGNNTFREEHSKAFEGKLFKGETVYYEVVGFTMDGTPIMASVDNKKVDNANGDKTFSSQYGARTVFSYGCAPTGKKLMHGSDDHGAFSIDMSVPQSDLFVYRMTMTNEDGDVVEYPPDFVRYRCKQMGVKCVQMFKRFIIPEPDANGGYSFMDGDGNLLHLSSAGEYVKAMAELFYDGVDPVGKTHVREGVVVRIVDRPKFAAYKIKNFSFKVLEGLIKETAAAPDMEEAEELAAEDAMAG